MNKSQIRVIVYKTYNNTINIPSAPDGWTIYTNVEYIIKNFSPLIDVFIF